MLTSMSASAPLTLKQRAIRAGVWSFAGFGLSQAVRLGGSLVMTRLLVPEMFGVMAVVMMVTAIISLLSDIGLSQHIIQSRRGADPAFLDTAWVVQIIRGLVLWLIALVMGVAVHAAGVAGLLPGESVYAFPGLPTIIAVSSFSVVIQGFQSTKIATADRSFNQKRLAQLELVVQVAGLAAMIAIAWASRSIWALVAGGLVSSLVKTALSHAWMSGHPNRFRLDSGALRDMLRFGKWIFLSSAVGVLAANGDRLLLGGFVDPHVMGLYAIAGLIIGAIEAGVTRLFATVSLPALSEIARNDAARLREVYNRLRVPGDLALLFLAGLLFAAGPQVIELLYDPRYAQAGAMLQVLALWFFTSRYGIAQQLYLAVGLPRYVAAVNAVRMVALYALVPPLFSVAGVEGAIWGIALHGLATLPFIYRFNRKLGVLDVRRELTVLAALPAGYLCGAPLKLLGG
jgi:O-antigen/teichoic acid export membrane protein